MFWVLFLLAAWAGVLVSCARLLVAATRAAEPASGSASSHHHTELSLYEAAYLAGGPLRVADLTLLSMQRERRLLLAHTGWATVVDPVGRDPHERSVLGAFGPDGQSPVPALRYTVAEDDAVRDLADRLGEAGLALSEGVRGGIGEGVRAVQGATLLVLAMAAAALAVPFEGTSATIVAVWFLLPLILSLSCLGIARFDGHLHSSWASPAGQRLLVALDEERGEEESLTAVAVRGVRAVGDPGLRAALGYGNRGRIPGQRGQ
ncbi:MULTISPECIES: TIGR04222 domain-containing membrane protein [unclassified Streptomyces]|uniref:TIGR04222 domain-containing membrane protein n=1 Tax=unclassified Streptomyces TaxID=2593676 RepID=UPI0036493B5B